MAQTYLPHERPRFLAGRPHVTRAAIAALQLAEVPDVLLLARHLHGDWGDVRSSDALLNELALLLNLRIHSRYALPTGAVFEIVTLDDRSATVLSLRDEPDRSPS
ncbi:hypothetical protein [Caballeronia sp. LZ034LL]|uniref:hypothetical protein n=1 Tax=Caballeronia sp. LZ034LL TaxID=3038567 RepID=UPI002855E190|nr:hypothetical protein [Caballeronia sp. LZ034LL]MDR5835381.1 hypothetical protein [Caballeronia sp. LZ034LL]